MFQDSKLFCMKEESVHFAWWHWNTEGTERIWFWFI